MFNATSERNRNRYSAQKAALPEVFSHSEKQERSLPIGDKARVRLFIQLSPLRLERSGK